MNWTHSWLWKLDSEIGSFSWNQRKVIGKLIQELILQPVPFNMFPLAISILASLSLSLFQLAFSRINHTGVHVVTKCYSIILTLYLSIWLAILWNTTKTVIVTFKKYITKFWGGKDSYLYHWKYVGEKHLWNSFSSSFLMTDAGWKRKGIFQNIDRFSDLLTLAVVKSGRIGMYPNARIY